MTRPEMCSPVSAVPGLVEAEEGHTRACVTVDAAEAVFAGHYPGLPIFPGMCIVEHVRLAALAYLPETPSGWRLAAIESGRFLSPVRPADRLTIDCAWSAEGADRRCAATVTTGRGLVARVRLRFEADEPEEREGAC
jgi:3-hydroxyacyl-[acyl-carrier-protein] dehydratase